MGMFLELPRRERERSEIQRVRPRETGRKGETLPWGRAREGDRREGRGKDHKQATRQEGRCTECKRERRDQGFG